MPGLGIGLGLALTPASRAEVPVPLPAGFGWDSVRFPLEITRTGAGFVTGIDPRSLVDPNIWTGAAIHVDGVAGDDGQTGLGAFDGDFSAAKRTIWAAFVAGNATAAPYRVIVKPGQYTESAFTRNGNDEPDQPVAILGWNGTVQYRTGPFSMSWTDAGGTWTTPLSAVRRAFRTDVTTPQGLYTGLTKVADAATCAATPDSWCDVAGTVHVNAGTAPAAGQVMLIRSFHGARFLTHAHDLYLENIQCEGGISGALHVDAIASRNVVGVNCVFRYSAPSNENSPLDAVQLRRTNGLAAFFGCDASGGAEDGWSFHEDGNAGLHVLMQDCTGLGNGGIYPVATSCNGFTLHDGVRGIDLNGHYGWSGNGTEVHCIQTSHAWLAGTEAVARDIDGTSTAFKCSNSAQVWLQSTTADAAGSPVNFAIEVNGGGAVLHTRDHVTLAGTVNLSNGGSVVPF